MINLHILQQSPVPMALFDKDANLKMASSAWKLFFEEVSTEVPEGIASALQNNIPEGEDCFKTKGDTQWYRYFIQHQEEEFLVYVKDITSEKQHKKAAVFLSEATEVTQLGTWFFDVEREFLEWSNITKDIFQVDESFQPNMEVMFSFFKEGTHSDLVINSINRAISEGTSFDVELQITPSADIEKWIRFRGKPEILQQKTGSIYGTIQDISEQKNTELKLALNEKQIKSTKRALTQNKQIFTSIFNSTFQFTGFLNIKGRLIDVNEPALNFVGLQAEDVINKHFWDTPWWKGSPKEQKKLRKNFKKAVKGEFVRYEAKILDKNQQAVYIDFSLKPVFDDHNKVTFLIAEGRIIQEMVEARKKLKESEKLHRTLLELSPTGLVLNDALTGEFLDMNNSFKSSIGYSDRELSKLTHLDLIPTVNRKKELRALKEVLNSGMYGPYEGHYEHKNGELVPALITRILITNSTGKKLIWSVVQDISHIKEKEAELMEVINVASEQNNRLLNFAHIVSHNLRSHASNFSMLIELLGVEDDVFKKVEIIEMLGSASKNMLETISNLNEIIAINTNLNIKTEKVNLKAEVDEAFTNISELIKSTFTEVENNIPENININVVKAYLESILLNIFTNAIKYKAPKRYPKIIINCERIKGFTVLSVTDNGLGIDLEKHGHKLFGMYKTFHGNTDARGIGLFITKNQIEAMKGKIEAESVLDKGTTFKIYFNENY
ncbi:PAS domain-containing sensor histidine kinase [Galbibacter sp. BG1]|uniref:PAS domain-containing sensor histidine kinase n=1 Tax=Galbibacter sp. BG1 TaxID=1170699 RepID=UPI0015BFD134|nr:PAS domain-containing sensor histidine kinase [Galbibacter sp. BG1]QLE01652.1 PAS domain-containing sensor histidine kinase [Galbibacter sp. BG1]